MNLPVFMLRIIAFFQALVSFLTFGIWWTEVTYPTDPIVIPAPENPAQLQLDNFTLVWSDEFDGDSLDTSKWTGYKCGGDKSVTRLGCWWNTDMAQVSGGNLHIKTKLYDKGYEGGKKAGTAAASAQTACLIRPTDILRFAAFLPREWECGPLSG
jgi:hypothetical protein